MNPPGAGSCRRQSLQVNWEPGYKGLQWRTKRIIVSTEERCGSNTIKECLGSIGEVRIKEQIKGGETGNEETSQEGFCSSLESSFWIFTTEDWIHNHSNKCHPSCKIQSKRDHIPNVCYLIPKYIWKL